MLVRGQYFDGYYTGNGQYKIRFMPKSMGVFEYEIISDIKEINGHKGTFASIWESNDNRIDKGQKLKNWYSDVLEPEFLEGVIMGAKTLNQYRKIFLDDFARLFEIIK